VACENMANQDRCASRILGCRRVRSRALQCMLASCPILCLSPQWAAAIS
jgi:hypothetical protein